MPPTFVIAATIMDYRDGPTRDLAYDAMDRDESVRPRVEELVKKKQ